MLKSLIKSIVLTVTCLAMVSATANPQPQKHQIVLTKDNVLSLDGEMDDEGMAKLAVQARAMDSRLPSNEPLYLVISSPGGSIDAGLELISNLKTLNRPVHTISIFSASMAFHTVQGLGTRYVLETGTLMSHKARGGMQGEIPGQFDSRYAYHLKRILKLDEKVVARSNGKQTVESYTAAYANELWCDGQECVDKGLADEVIPVTCDKSLEGTKKDVTAVSFMGLRLEVGVVKAACPTITGILGVETGKDGHKFELETLTTNKYDYPNITPENIKELQHKIEEVVAKHDGSKRTVKGY